MLVIPFLTTARTGAQDLDSIAKVVRTAKQDTTKVIALNDLGWRLMYTNPDTAIILGEQALVLSKEGNHLKHQAKSLSNLGVYNAIKSDYDKALEYYGRAMVLYEKLDNLEGIAGIHNNAGIAYAEQSEFNKALEHYRQSLDILIKLGKKRGVAIAYNSIGNIYVDLADYKKAIESHLKSLAIKQELGDKDGMAFSYNNLGLVYKKQSDFPKALDYYFKSLEIRQGMNDKRGMALVLDNIGGVYREQSDYETAVDYHLKSLQLVKELEYAPGMAYSFNNLAGVFAEQKDYIRAVEYYRNALDIFSELGNVGAMAIVYNNIGALYVESYSDKIAGENSNPEIRGSSTLLDSALTYLQGAFQINSQFDIKESLIYNMHDMGNVYLLKNQFSKAIDFYNREAQLSREIGNLQGEYEACNGLAKAYKKWAASSVDHKTRADYLLMSLDYHEQYVTVRDSVFSEEKQRDIGKLEAQHDYEMADIRRAQQEKEEAELANANQNRRNMLQYSASLFSICVLFGALFFVARLALPKWAMELSVFVPFLILFEFLLVLTDPYVDRWTGGEPGFNLLINAFFAGLIFPVHSFFEKLLKKRLFRKATAEYKEVTTHP